MKVIQRRLMLHRHPDEIDLPTQPLIQLPLLQPPQRLPQLPHPTRAHNQRISKLRIQRAIPRHPPIRHLPLRQPRIRRQRVPPIQRLEIRRTGVETAVQIPRRPPRLALLQRLARLHQEPARRGRVGVEGYVQLAQRGEELGFLPARDRAVVPLVDGGEHEAVRGAVGVDLLDVRGAEVG